MATAGTMSARVGANVKRYRAERGMTLQRLTELLDDVGLHMSVSALSRVEHGERSVTVDHLVSMAEALDVAPAELLEAQTVTVSTDTGTLTVVIDRSDEAPRLRTVENGADATLLEALTTVVGTWRR